MQFKPILLLAILVLGAGGAAWLAWGRGEGQAPDSQPDLGTRPTGSAPSPLARASDTPSGNRDSTRTVALPPASPAVVPPVEAPEPAQPLPGAGVTAIYGGPEALQDFYRAIDTDGRRSRLQELEAALAEYNGDPAERREFAKYQAIKEEVLWLQAHPDP